MSGVDEILKAIAHKLENFTSLEFFLTILVIGLITIVIVQNKDFFLTLLGKKPSKSDKKSQPTINIPTTINNTNTISETNKNIIDILNEIDKLRLRVEYIEKNIESILTKLNNNTDFQKEKIPELLLEITKLTAETKLISKEIETIKHHVTSIDDNVKSISNKRDVSF
jgi:archaellum component FlaC